MIINLKLDGKESISAVAVQCIRLVDTEGNLISIWYPMAGTSTTVPNTNGMPKLEIYAHEIMRTVLGDGS